MIKNLRKKFKEVIIKNDEFSRKKSDENRIKKLVKLKKGNLSTQQWMKRDWDERAKSDVKFFIRAVNDQTQEDFWQSGIVGRDQILGVGTSRYNKIFKNNNPKNMRVLEIGCGIGRILIPMSEVFGEAVGVDVSKKMVDIAQDHIKNISNCKVFVNNGSDLKIFLDNYFDFCYSFIVFQHIPEKNIVINYIKEVSRVLKPGSLFYFQLRGNTPKSTQVNTWEGVSFSSEEVYKIAKDYKFAILEETGKNEWYYFLTFKSIK